MSLGLLYILYPPAEWSYKAYPPPPPGSGVSGFKRKILYKKCVECGEMM